MVYIMNDVISHVRDWTPGARMNYLSRAPALTAQACVYRELKISLSVLHVSLPFWWQCSSCLLLNGHRVFFPGLQLPGRDVNHPPPLTPRLKKEWTYTSAPGILYGEILMAELLYCLSW